MTAFKNSRAGTASIYRSGTQCYTDSNLDPKFPVSRSSGIGTSDLSCLRHFPGSEIYPGRLLLGIFHRCRNRTGLNFDRSPNRRTNPDRSRLFGGAAGLCCAERNSPPKMAAARSGLLQRRGHMWQHFRPSDHRHPGKAGSGIRLEDLLLDRVRHVGDNGSRVVLRLQTSPPTCPDRVDNMAKAGQA